LIIATPVIDEDVPIVLGVNDEAMTRRCISPAERVMYDELPRRPAQRAARQ
jgi:hypothetical protein